MSLLKRKPIKIGRQQRDFRDDRFFIIATEDTHAPKNYFEALKISRVKMLVLESQEGQSAPKHVLEKLQDAFKSSNEKDDKLEDDEFWMLIDTDHHFKKNHKKDTIQTLNEARKSGFKIGISNPSFEVWLLLHHIEISKEIATAKEAEKKLRETIGSYNKSSVDTSKFPASSIPEAIQRAKKLENLFSTQKGHWPNKTGTRVYKLLESITKKRAK